MHTTLCCRIHWRIYVNRISTFKNIKKILLSCFSGSPSTGRRRDQIVHHLPLPTSPSQFLQVHVGHLWVPVQSEEIQCTTVLRGGGSTQHSRPSY
jgi:hypothetical protein